MSLQEAKTDPALGSKVRTHLLKMGVETPLSILSGSLSDKTKINEIERHVRAIMQLLDLDLNDDSLRGTPLRVAKMYVNEIFWGLKAENFPKCTTVENKMKYDEMVIEREINVQSNCEHHLVVIDGRATVAYIPNKKVLGLSKINRVVEYFSKRPQIQERLTEQVFHALTYILGTKDVAVVIDAQHYCVKSRGVEDINSHTVTSKLGGRFKTEDSLRAEFMALARK